MTEELDSTELDEQDATPLPDREAMSLITPTGDGFVDLELGNDQPPIPQDAAQ